jgi:Universal stress protein family
MIECILVPTDFSKPSLAAIGYALELADAVDGRMILLHVVEGEPVHSYMVGERPPLLRDEFASDRDLPLCPLPQRIIRRDLCEEAYGRLAVMCAPGDQNRIHTDLLHGCEQFDLQNVPRQRILDTGDTNDPFARALVSGVLWSSPQHMRRIACAVRLLSETGVVAPLGAAPGPPVEPAS